MIKDSIFMCVVVGVFVFEHVCVRALVRALVHACARVKGEMRTWCVVFCCTTVCHLLQQDAAATRELVREGVCPPIYSITQTAFFV